MKQYYNTLIFQKENIHNYLKIVKNKHKKITKKNIKIHKQE